MTGDAGRFRPRRLVYLGTPEVAVPPLRALHAAGFDLALVVTRPDTRRGRGSTSSPSPVKVAALDLGVPVSTEVEDALDTGADLGVVVAYGRLIRPHVLEQLPMVNLHFSLLPRWRGAAPVERALLAGDTETGVCVMDVVEGLDEGGVHSVARVEIGPDDTADELRTRLVEAGTTLLVDTLRLGLGVAEPQVGAASYAAKIGPEDLVLDWSAPAAHLHRIVRVGGAWTTWRGTRLKVWAADVQPGSAELGPGQLTPVAGGVAVGAGEGRLVLREVQPEGRARQPADAWWRGARPAPGEMLGG